jgi:hypothetical protein
MVRSQRFDLGELTARSGAEPLSLPLCDPVGLFFRGVFASVN